MKGFLVVVLTVLVSSWVASQALRSRPRKVGEYWTFPPTVAVRAVFSFGIALGASLAFFSLWGPKADRPITVSIGALFIAMASLGWPQTIAFFQNGLRQRTWYRKWKKIPWADIVEVKKRRDGSVMVRGKNSKIVFSTDHSGRDQFLEEMERHGLRVSEKKGYSRR